MAVSTDRTPIPAPSEMSPGLATPENPVVAGRPAGIAARLLHGTAAGVAAYGLGIASNLLLLPLYLRFWSVRVYGEWMALYSVVYYLANLDFGVTVAGMNAATMAYARGDWPAFKRIQGTAWAASLGIAALGIALIALPSLFFFHVERWLHLTALAPREAHLVFCCLAISLLANIPGRQLIGVYIAIGEFAKYQWLYNAFAVATFAATAIVLSCGRRSSDSSRGDSGDGHFHDSSCGMAAPSAGPPPGSEPSRGGLADGSCARGAHRSVRAFDVRNFADPAGAGRSPEPRAWRPRGRAFHHHPHRRQRH